jgi:hypothetical protein
MRILIEGNIAAGKPGTLLKNAPDNVFIVMEALEKWKSSPWRIQTKPKKSDAEKMKFQLSHVILKGQRS